MIEQEITLLTNGRISFQKCGNGLQFGYSKNRDVYSIKVKTSGEWNGLTIRAFWHVPDGKDPASSLVVNGYVGVPASVTAQPGSGCVTFEAGDGAGVKLDYQRDVNIAIKKLEDAIASMT